MSKIFFKNKKFNTLKRKYFQILFGVCVYTPACMQQYAGHEARVRVGEWLSGVTSYHPWDLGTNLGHHACSLLGTETSCQPRKWGFIESLFLSRFSGKWKLTKWILKVPIRNFDFPWANTTGPHSQLCLGIPAFMFQSNFKARLCSSSTTQGWREERGSYGVWVSLHTTQRFVPQILKWSSPRPLSGGRWGTLLTLFSLFAALTSSQEEPASPLPLPW